MHSLKSSDGLLRSNESPRTNNALFGNLNIPIVTCSALSGFSRLINQVTEFGKQLPGMQMLDNGNALLLEITKQIWIIIDLMKQLDKIVIPASIHTPKYRYIYSRGL
jgi:hypothetical protein